MRVRYKKNRMVQFYESECLKTVPHVQPPALAGPFKQCVECPYSGHGFICWGCGGETCLRTEVHRIMRQDRGGL